MTPPTRSIPSKYRRSAFDRFARDIGLIVKAFPAAVLIDDLHGLAPDTYAACLRAALYAKRVHGYTHPSIDEMLFLQCGQEIVVRLRPDGTIVAGGHNETREEKGVGLRQPVGDMILTVEILNPTKDDCLAACRLLASRRLQPPLQFSVAIDEHLARLVEENGGDVSVIEEKGRYILI